MTLPMTEELRQALQRETQSPVTIEDSETWTEYVLLPRRQYERLKALLDPDSPAAAYPLIEGAFAGPEGWDAPGMELYNHKS